MKIILVSLLLSIHLGVFSQKLTIKDLERIVRYELFETDTSFSRIGFTYYSSDSNEVCKFHMWRNEKLKTILDLQSITKTYCIRRGNQINYSVFNKSLFQSFRDKLQITGYKLVNTFSDNRGLNSVYRKGVYYVRLTQGQLKTDSGSYTEYNVSISDGELQ
jgi:hypothetical protein